VRLVVRGVQQVTPVVAQRRAEPPVQPELVFDPRGPGERELGESPRRDRQEGLQNPVEFEDRLLVEPHGREVGGADAALAQAVLHGAGRKPGVALLASEPLLGCGGDDFPIHEQRRGAVVIVRRDTEDA